MAGYPVQVSGLSYSPPGLPNVVLLDDVTCRIEGGEFVGVVGRNGAGKSTFLNAISGEIEPTAGSVVVAGQRVEGPIHRLIDEVGQVHQDSADDLLLHRSIASNVSFRRQNNGCHENRVLSSSQSFRSRLSAELHRYAPQLREDTRTLVAYLSGGQRQLFNLSLALHLEHRNRKCSLLLLDEHTASLDVPNAERVMQYTARQVRESQTTCLMVTHRPDFVVRFCTAYLVVEDRKLKGPCQIAKGMTAQDLAKEAGLG